jgi:hypothetical protein
MYWPIGIKIGGKTIVVAMACLDDFIEAYIPD